MSEIQHPEQLAALNAAQTLLAQTQAQKETLEKNLTRVRQDLSQAHQTKVQAQEAYANGGSLETLTTVQATVTALEQTVQSLESQLNALSDGVKSAEKGVSDAQGRLEFTIKQEAYRTAKAAYEQHIEDAGLEAEKLFAKTYELLEALRVAQLEATGKWDWMLHSSKDTPQRLQYKLGFGEYYKVTKGAELEKEKLEKQKAMR
jgi:predicted  nucleic acid-binding Zn-ribbon protein